MVMDFDFTLLGEVPAPKSFMVRREFRGVGSFKLTVQRDAGGLLARDRVIYRPDRPEQGWIIHRVSRSGDTLTVDGTPLKGLAKRRICLPPLITGGAYNQFGYDLFTGDAESAYLHFAANNLTAPEDAARAIPHLVLDTNLHRGPELPWQARFEKLSDLFEDIGAATEVGWDIRPDFGAKRYVFGEWAGVDRTTGTGRCALSRELGNVEGGSVTEDAGSAVTVVYAGGAGEDENRLIQSYGSENAGLTRYEAFEDCGSIDDTEMLALAARRKLTGPSRTMTADVVDGGLCRYERDYDVGDVVTVVLDGWRMDARLIAMQETWEGGRRTLKATFGDPPLGVTELLRRERKRVVR